MFSSSTIAFVKLRDPIDFRRRRYAAAGIRKPTRKLLAKAAKRGERASGTGSWNEALAYISILTDLPVAACQLLSHDDVKALMVEIDKLIGGASI